MNINKLTAALLLTLLTAGSSLHAQGVESPFQFDSYEFDFGNIKESDGIVTHTFHLYNKTSSPVKIESVATSCGCTTADYQTTPIEPGKMAQIEVAFNPARTEGKVFREIEIFSMNGKSLDRLELIADVEAAPLTVEQLYPVQISESLRTSLTHIRFGYIAAGHKESKSMVMVNTSEKDVRIEVVCQGSGMLEADAPRILKAGSAESVIFTYNIPEGTQTYGTIRDTALVYEGNVLCGEVYFASAVITDDFSDQEQGAPHINVDPTYYDFGTNPARRVMKRSLTLTNDGDKPLVVRAVECSEGAVTDISAGTVIEPGRSLKASAAVQTPAEPGQAAYGSIDLITNDPMRPRKEIRLRTVAR